MLKAGDLQIGDRVRVDYGRQSQWNGEGTVTQLWTDTRNRQCYNVLMETGEFAGAVGGFDFKCLELSDINIVNQKRSYWLKILES